MRAPLHETGHRRAISPLRVRAIRGPKIDDDDLAAVIAQTVTISLEVGQFKVRSEAIQFHKEIIS